RRLASLTGFHSAGFLKMILEGKRNISEESIQKIARGLKLKREEADYFKTLVYLNQAESTEDKKLYAKELLSYRKFRELHPLKSAQFDFYAKWHCIVVRELVGFKGFREDPRWIASAVEPAITAAEARA